MCCSFSTSSFSSILFHCLKNYVISTVPVFDAQETSQDADVDFDDLDGVFSRFQGEIPYGSCVAVGHSVSSYIGKKDDEEKIGTKIHLATNILFVIVFGTPPF